MSNKLKNLLSIDLEDWYHFIGDPAAPSFAEWPRCRSRVEETTGQLLEIIGDNSATFFVLGYIAERHPELIKRIASLGHEIACHGYKHDFVFKLGPVKFKEDIRRCKTLLQDLTGNPCNGYRAPGFSIRQQDMWAFEIIQEEGFLYDSSLFPGVRTAGGIPNGNPFPHTLYTQIGPLFEIPVSTSRMFGITTAFCGGGFFRFFPENYIHRHIKKINQRQQPAVVYIHPRDIDPKQPRMELKPLNRFMYYFGLKRAKVKFTRLIGGFNWMNFQRYAEEHRSDPA